MPADPAQPAVSIVIPTLGRAEHLAACLDSIAATVHAPCEVICATVADDGPTQELLARRPHVKNLIDPARTGFVRAANRGLRCVRAPWALLLNDDCVLLPRSVDNALFFASAPAHADAGQVAFFHDTPLRRNIWQEVTVEGVRYIACHVRGLPFANFGMTRTDVLSRVGYLDERYRMYAADPDLSLKVWLEAGMRVLACPGALVHHAELADERGARERAAQHEDNDRLFAKWGLAPADRGSPCPPPTPPSRSS